MKVNFSLYYHPLYSDGLDKTARFPVDRYRMIAEKIRLLDVGKKILIKEPRQAKREEILLVHKQDFVDRFLAGDLSEKEIRRIGLKPWKKEIIDRTLHLVGGALEGLNDLLNGATIAGNMAGGTHHAFRGEGSGYCIFNDIAIAAEVALKTESVNRILVIDLDVHQGDGTAEIFRNDPRVYTVSLHGENNFPFRKKTSDFDLGFANGTKDEEYLFQLDQVLKGLINEPFDLIFFQAGVDGLDSDSLGLLSLTRAGLKKRNAQIFQFRKKVMRPMLIFMGGGYAKPIEDTVDAFCDLFLGASEEIQLVTPSQI